jgi:glucose-6-phosphate isomerase
VNGVVYVSFGETNSPDIGSFDRRGVGGGSLLSLQRVGHNHRVTFTDLKSGLLSGSNIVAATKTVGDLGPYWANPGAVIDPGQVLYQTQMYAAAPDGTEGVVLWGNTTLMPGRVGDEFHMTRGHRHLKATHGELCVTVSGKGALLLMDGERNTRMEQMTSGSTHWIDGKLAHRTVNTGGEPLVFLCAWPADCGHDYDEIAKQGFSSMLVFIGGGPRLIAKP